MTIKSQQTYQHGGNIKEFAKEIDCHIDEVIDLSSNINFVKPNIEIDFNTLNISAYPNYDKLYDAIAKLYQVKNEQIELFNGATTAIYALFRQLNLNHCTLYTPCYLEYKKSAELYGYEIDFIDRFTDIEKNIQDKSLVIFVNPSTPDGKFYNIEKLMKKWIKKECTILIDESFLDFTPFESATKYLDYSKLYILKSMTKFYASAGIRIGAIISNRENIKTIQQQEPLWKISQFDSHYLQSALRDEEFIKKSRSLNNQNRNYLIQLLEKSNYIKKVYPSSANFIMVKLKNINAIKFQKLLIPHKIMVRDCENFDFLDDSFVRIAIKDIISLKMLKRVL
ncbi:MAG: histidinol-phosphate aminotransferase family protein [Sulfurovaceae bacterium]|nr:histidinol-phosphate aminotransferase family protein [Sulfurovaceae bacterium]